MSFPGVRKRITITVKNLAGALTDATLTVKLRAAGAAISDITANVVHDSTGTYHVDVDCPTPGEWSVRTIISGTLTGAEEFSWQVQRSAFV